MAGNYGSDLLVMVMIELIMMNEWLANEACDTSDNNIFS